MPGYQPPPAYVVTLATSPVPPSPAAETNRLLREISSRLGNVEGKVDGLQGAVESLDNRLLGVENTGRENLSTTTAGYRNHDAALSEEVKDLKGQLASMQGALERIRTPVTWPWQRIAKYGGGMLGTAYVTSQIVPLANFLKLYPHLLPNLLNGIGHLFTGGAKTLDG